MPLCAQYVHKPSITVCHVKNLLPEVCLLQNSLIHQWKESNTNFFRIQVSKAMLDRSSTTQSKKTKAWHNHSTLGEQEVELKEIAQAWRPCEDQRIQGRTKSACKQDQIGDQRGKVEVNKGIKRLCSQLLSWFLVRDRGSINI